MEKEVSELKKNAYDILMESNELTTEQKEIISQMEINLITRETKAISSRNRAIDELEKVKRILKDLRLDLKAYREREELRLLNKNKD